MIQRSLEFKCHRCQINLNMPTAMEEMSIVNLRKFFKLMNEEYWRNEDSTRLFFSYIPEIQADLRDKWNEESLTFQNEYRDPRFDASGNYIDEKTERDKRRNYNDKLSDRVKAAKARYERFQRRIPKLEELKEQYQR